MEKSGNKVLGVEVEPVEFIENLEGYVGKFESADAAHGAQQERYGRYRQLEARLNANRGNLHKKIPELKGTLQAMQFLRDKMEAGEAVRARYELNSQLYAAAEVKDVKAVSLWLGANVMVEYSFDEAEKLLTENIDTASASLSRLDEELAFVKDQITTAEVNIARVINHNVAKSKK